MKSLVYHTKKVIYFINKIKDKNHTVISVDAEKPFDRVQDPFMIRAINKLGIEGSFHNLLKAIDEKPSSSIIFNGEKLEVFS